MNAKLIASLILAGLAVVFTMQNVAVIDLTFLFWTLSMSMTLAMFLILSIGIISGWMLRGTISRRKGSGHNKQGGVSEQTNN